MNSFIRSLLLIFLPLFVFHTSLAHNPGRVSLSYRTPTFTVQGIVVTSGNSSVLALIKGASLVPLVSSPGCGYYFSISHDGGKVGVKLIDSSGMQTPAVIDPQKGEIIRLHEPAQQVGQVSFSLDGTTAYTVGNDLIVGNSGTRQIHNLGTYANIAPISPDGRFVAFNDNNDQIWIMNLKTHSRSQISDAQQGYFGPQWSRSGQRILYSGLNGTLKVYDSVSKSTYTLGEGYSPSWSHDSEWIIYYKKEIRNFELINSDIYLSRHDGSLTRNLTNTPDIMEMDPSFTENDGSIVFTTANTHEVQRAMISANGSPLSEPVVLLGPDQVAELDKSALLKSEPRNQELIALAANFEMPYIHQVYDTPDWFNGHWACGPTTAMMVLAYYNVLPEWDTWCSQPYPGHISPWGRYISDTYNFRQFSYAAQAEDPNGRPASGAYGFMWASGSPHSMMAAYYAQHGIPAVTTDGPPNSTAVAEVTAGYPYSMCVGLTSAGHIVAAHGVGTEEHTLVVNDPYGNKNRPGYPNYYGKNASYDWPGYNNGYQNFVNVYWCTTTHSALPPPPDTLVDDMAFGNGFYLHTRAPASMVLWKDLNKGFNKHMWFTYTRGPEGTDTCYAIWRPNLKTEGLYEVSAYISFSEATAARYRISHAATIDTVVVNQKNYAEAWVPLGTFRFEQGDSGSVTLGDVSTVRGQPIVFDAMRWQLKNSGTSTVMDHGPQAVPAEYELLQNYPNPFNPSTTIMYALPATAFTELKVFDILGREVVTLVNEVRARGYHEITWNGTAGNGARVPSGAYFYRISSRELEGKAVYQSVRRMIVLQ